jgi:hypothetical protein
VLQGKGNELKRGLWMSRGRFHVEEVSRCNSSPVSRRDCSVTEQCRFGPGDLESSRPDISGRDRKESLAMLEDERKRGRDVKFAKSLRTG